MYWGIPIADDGRRVMPVMIVRIAPSDQRRMSSSHRTWSFREVWNRKDPLGGYNHPLSMSADERKTRNCPVETCCCCCCCSNYYVFCCDRGFSGCCSPSSCYYLPQRKKTICGTRTSTMMMMMIVLVAVVSPTPLLSYYYYCCSWMPHGSVAILANIVHLVFD